MSKVFQLKQVIAIMMTLVLFIMQCSLKVPGVYAGSDGDNEDIQVNLENEKDRDYVMRFNDLSKQNIDEIEKDKDTDLLVKNGDVAIFQSDKAAGNTEAINNKSDNIIIEENIQFSASETALNSEELWFTEDELKQVEPEKPDWNQEMISAESTQENNICTNPVKVAVIDSGVEWFSDVNLKEEENFVEYEQDVPFYMSDATGHGTAVASIINKIYPDAEVYSARVLDLSNKTNLERIIRALYWCMDKQVDVINISIGASQYSKLLEEVIQEAVSRGIVVVASAGNGAEQGVEYPAAYDTVIAVGSVDNHAEKSDFSAEGSEVDVVAPGESIEVQSLLGMYTWADGTSLSAPHVAAEAAILLEKDKSKDSEFIKKLIRKTAVDLSDNTDCGEGLININRAQELYNEFEKQYDNKEATDNVILNADTEDNIPEFSDDQTDYKGRWIVKDHVSSMGKSNDPVYKGMITSTAMKAIKRGAMYNDLEKKENGEKVFPAHWHGQYRLLNDDGKAYHENNYIADYRLIRKLANNNGDSSGIKRTDCKWIRDANFNSIISRFKNGKLAGKEWSAVIDQKPNGTYSAENASLLNAYYDTKLYTGTNSRKATLRRCFLYGMALHNVTDAYSHSTFAGQSLYQLIVHTDKEESSLINKEKYTNKRAHDKTFLPNRFNDAKSAAVRVVRACKDIGEHVNIAETFAPNPNASTIPKVGSRGYYLGRVLYYAEEVNGTIESHKEDSKFKKYFNAIDYNAPINEK